MRTSTQPHISNSDNRRHLTTNHVFTVRVSGTAYFICGYSKDHTGLTVRGFDSMVERFGYKLVDIMVRVTTPWLKR